jgi:predicted permease
VNFLSHPLFQSLSPVFIIIAAGYWLGRRSLITTKGVGDLSNLVFLVLIPALLFRTMSGVDFQTLELSPIAAYFVAVALLFAVSVWWRGLNCASVVLGLAGVFSNMVMVGIALIGLAYGQQGLVTLLTLVSVHALILLTVGSLVLELAAAKERRSTGAESPRPFKVAWRAMKASIIHPIPLPIICGLLYAQTGMPIPSMIDVPLKMLGQAFGPVALILVGVSLAKTQLLGEWRQVLTVALLKNIVLPLLVGLSAWLFGIRGLPLVVMIVTAALPIGANVLLFAQRYKVMKEVTVTAMGVSTLLAAVTLSIVMLLVSLIPIY